MDKHYTCTQGTPLSSHLSVNNHKMWMNFKHFVLSARSQSYVLYDSIYMVSWKSQNCPGRGHITGLELRRGWKRV